VLAFEDFLDAKRVLGVSARRVPFAPDRVKAALEKA
jgi:hypothetical protein